MTTEIHGLPSQIIKKNEDLFAALVRSLRKNHQTLRNGDIVVLSSKVVALTQGRLVRLDDVKVSAAAKTLRRTRYGNGQEDPRLVELILKESDAILPGTMLTTLKDGMLVPSSGIDRSNVPKEYAILWPKDYWKVAQRLRSQLKKKFHLQKLGLVICDSNCQPLRWGTTGLAISWAGFEGVEDARGQLDIHNELLKHTRKAMADNLASAALLVMGEAGERIPFCLIRRALVKFTNRTQHAKDAQVKPEECIFSGAYSKKFLKLYKQSQSP